MPSGGAPEGLKQLISDGIAAPSLVAHVSILVAARIPLIVAGSADHATRERIADAFAAATPLAEGVSEIEIADGERFTWLADPAGVGCTIEGAGVAPRSPRNTRLRARALLEGLDPVVARALIRSLVRGYQLIATAVAPDFAALRDALRVTPYRIPEDDLLRLGVALFVDAAGSTAASGATPNGRVASAYLLHTPDPAVTTRRPPTLLAAWNQRSADWDDFAWAAVPDLAARTGSRHEAYAALLAEREQLLGHPGSGETGSGETGSGENGAGA
jgi:hypothetical protein